MFICAWSWFHESPILALIYSLKSTLSWKQQNATKVPSSNIQINKLMCLDIRPRGHSITTQSTKLCLANFYLSPHYHLSTMCVCLCWVYTWGLQWVEKSNQLLSGSLRRWCERIDKPTKARVAFFLPISDTINRPLYSPTTGNHGQTVMHGYCWRLYKVLYGFMLALRFK